MAAFRALVIHSQTEALGELVEVLAGPQLTVDTARSMTEALNRVSQQDYAVVVADHRPPEMNGLELLERTQAYLPDALRILLAASPDAAGDLPHKPAGTIFRFFARPWERWQLQAVVSEGLKLHRLEREQRDLIQKLGREHEKLRKREKLLDVVVKERTREIEDAYLKLKAANRQALLGLAEAIEAKDAYTKGHCGRVAAFGMHLARACKYPEADMEALEFASFLHDIGKIGIRDAVLLKPAALDPEEWIHMRTHAVKGYEIASQIEMLKPTMSAIRNHHERWDGGGYPDGLKDTDIPLAARIVCIADAYDAMATDRPYKKALPSEECEQLLRKNAGKMFDPELVEIFIKSGGTRLMDQVASDEAAAAEAAAAEAEAAEAEAAAERAVTIPAEAKA